MIACRWFTAASLVIVCACQKNAGPGDDPVALERRLRAHVNFLSSDELEGRGTPSRGLDAAAAYLESRLVEIGAEPVVNGSYRQKYRIGSYLPGEAKVTVKINGKPVDAKDYVFINVGRDPAKGPISLPLVEAGSGLVYEEKGIDELAKLDVRGKAVVVRKGAPWHLDASAVFGPDRAVGKLIAATVRGAELLVYLSEELDFCVEAECQFFKEMKQAPVGFVRDPMLKHASALNPILALRPKAYGSAPGSRIEIGIDAKVREADASNVLGLIGGTDSQLTKDHVLLTAHYDHLGSRPAKPGEDGIWNGADDNASGTAGVLEVAREVAQRPGKRSVLVFFTSGEGRGILGSAYYSAHPVIPISQIAVQLNLDMIGRSSGKVQAIAHHSPQLYRDAVAAGKAAGIEAIEDQQPSWRVTYLTDVYHFARAGVPGVEFFTGIHPDYHQPSDTAEKIHYREMVRIVAVASRMTRLYVDGKAKPAVERPKWFVTP